MHTVLPCFAKGKNKCEYINNLYAFDFYKKNAYSFAFEFKDNLKMIVLSNISNK